MPVFHQNVWVPADQPPAFTGPVQYHQLVPAANMAGQGSNNQNETIDGIPDYMSGQGSGGGEIENIDPSEAATGDSGEGSCGKKRSVWRRGCASPG